MSLNVITLKDKKKNQQKKSLKKKNLIFPFLLLKKMKEMNLYPTVKIECEKCGHGEAVGWMFQTRSADEPTTRFYRCQKCKYTWRDYT